MSNFLPSDILRCLGGAAIFSLDLWGESECSGSVRRLEEIGAGCTEALLLGTLSRIICYQIYAKLKNTIEWERVK